MSSFLMGLNIHPSWAGFINDPRVIAQLRVIERQVYGPTSPESTPALPLPLRFLELDLQQVRVVILGQDPYKPKGVANGRAFQPSDLLDWSQKFRQVSLKNIIRSVWACYNVGEVTSRNYESVASYAEIVRAIQRGDWWLPDPPKWFDGLEKQGVLFLNTSFTTEVGTSGAHEQLWRSFTNKLLWYINAQCPHAHWFIWGKSAKAATEGLPLRNTWVSNHPMMCSNTYFDDFLKNPCFVRTARILGINWIGADYGQV